MALFTTVLALMLILLLIPVCYVNGIELLYEKENAFVGQGLPYPALVLLYHIAAPYPLPPGGPRCITVMY